MTKLPFIVSDVTFGKDQDQDQPATACNNRREEKKDLTQPNPSWPNTAHRVSEYFFAFSMSVTLNGNSTVHSASAEFQTNSVIHPLTQSTIRCFVFHFTNQNIIICSFLTLVKCY
ncbi:hypothetical protein AAZX31_20G097800 [Glycine max]